MERPKLIRQYTGCIPNTMIPDPMMDHFREHKWYPSPKSTSLSDINSILNHPINKSLIKKHTVIRSKTN